jgi:hypothetical protein
LPAPSYFILRKSFIDCFEESLPLDLLRLDAYFLSKDETPLNGLKGFNGLVGRVELYEFVSVGIDENCLNLWNPLYFYFYFYFYRYFRNAGESFISFFIGYCLGS